MPGSSSNSKEVREFLAWDVAPPTSQEHGTDDQRAANAIQLKPTKWRMEGNKLIGQTNWGELVQYIDPGYVLTGTDNRGNPMFKKIG